MRIVGETRSRHQGVLLQAYVLNLLLVVHMRVQYVHVHVCMYVCLYIGTTSGMCVLCVVANLRNNFYVIAALVVIVYMYMYIVMLWSPNQFGVWEQCGV